MDKLTEAVRDLLSDIGTMRCEQPDGGSEFVDADPDMWYGPFEMNVDSAMVDPYECQYSGTKICWPSLQISAKKAEEALDEALAADRWWIVTARVEFDDEDSCFVFRATTQAEAEAMAFDELRSEESNPDAATYYIISVVDCGTGGPKPCVVNAQTDAIRPEESGR